MSIITISRGSYSRGREVAELLAGRLGYECVSRDILLDATEEFKTPEFKLIRALHDAPNILERFQHGKERYISYLRSALLQRVQKDNVVYHGLAGHYFLTGIPHVLKVRIIADMEDRVREEMKRENLTEDEALFILNKDDDERRRWGLQIYGTDTWDSRLYDMVLRIKKLSVEDVVDILYHAAQKPAFQTTPESQKMIENLALASHVKAKVVSIAPSVDVTADGGTVYLSFPREERGPSQDKLNELQEVAESVDGVESVNLSVPPTSKRGPRVNPFHRLR